ncbi:MAG: VIT1/CCC1 transporter family protein [Parcubacteria group bacterium]|nr:VIT1/CCC1 transporter family protein [Parcubacteria group bacterium]
MRYNITMHEEKDVTNIRNFVFGVEDSLVSTVGLLSGVAVAGTMPETIVLAGVVLIAVEAFSMGAGSLLSEHSARQISLRQEVPIQKSAKSALIMFFSYFFAGFIPLSPYIFLPISLAFWTSIGASLVALLILGTISGKIAGIRPLRPALEMLLIGGAAIALGAAVGVLFA